MSGLLNELNDAQREAVTTTAGPLLVIAGAGSGKTRVLTRRLAYLLYQRLAEPHQVLAVTFTNKAAGEMRARVSELVGGEIPGMQVSTFHSFCARLLRREAELLGYSDKFTIFDQSDSVTLVKNCIAELGLSATQFVPKAQLRKISTAKNGLISAEMYTQSSGGYFEQTTAKIYTRYQQRLRECDSMDFDDLLFNSVSLLRNFDEVGNRYRQRFRYVMVDEYQDTNRVQYLLLKALVGPERNICVVGDEDQSIYGWRGADIRNILDFEKDFPGAKIVKLEQNYRSTKTILGAAAAVIKHNDARKDKTLWSDGDNGEKLQYLLVDSAEEEARKVVSIIEDGRAETSLKQTAVLYRTNAQSRPFEEQLRRRNLPYQIVGGITFYQRKEIKDLMAYLKLIANPKDDVSFQRVVNYPKRGIGGKTLDNIMTGAREQSLSCFEVISRQAGGIELGPRAGRLQAFVELIEKYQAKSTEVPIDLLTQELVDDLGLIEELRAEDPIIGQTKVENVEAFIEGMAEFARGNGEATLVTYLAEISLFTDIDNYSGIEDKVTMMTIHAAKGLEFVAVYMVGLEEGLFPLERAIAEPMELEEERRLFYVGATRARRRLCLSSAASRFRFGEVASVPSRFIKEIPQEYLETINFRHTRSWHTEQPVRSHSAASQYGQQTEPSGVHYEYEGHEGLTIGRLVHHPTFGRGKILAMEGYGEGLRLDIMFSGIGVKKIMAKFARLKLIG
ncbi:MAG: UvrD-helicase domain-containing protein [bacterium]